MRFFILCLFFVVSSLFAESAEQGHDRWLGVRLTGGGAAYVGGIDSAANKRSANQNGYVNPTTNETVLPDYTKYVSVGWVAPLQLEVTYSPANAFELLLGGAI